MYPPVPAEKRKPIRVLSLFDGIATGRSMSWGQLDGGIHPLGDEVGRGGMEHNGLS